jgi:hypothetical protein
MTQTAIAASPVGPTSGGKIYAFNNIGSVSTVTVAPINNNRSQITFHNPGSVNMYVFPLLVQALNSVPANISTNATGSSITNQALTPSLASLGGGFMLYANGGQITLYGECQGGYQALAASGSNNSLTVSDSNV